MLKTLKYSLVAIAMFGLTGCLNKEVKIKKTAISESQIELTENFKFNSGTFIIKESDIKVIEKLNLDKEKLVAFHSLDFNNLKELQDYEFNLSKEKESQIVEMARRNILTEVFQLRGEKETEVDREIKGYKDIELLAIKELKSFEKNMDQYMKKINPILIEKSAMVKKIEASNINVKKSSSALSIKVNKALESLKAENSVLPDHFTKLMEAADCSENGYVVKNKSINFKYIVEDTCFKTYVPLAVEKSSLFLENEELINEIKNNLAFTTEELINNGTLKLLGRENYLNELEKIDLKLDEAYSATERKHGVTRYQLEGKKQLLKEAVIEKNKNYEKESNLRGKKIDYKMSLIDLNTLKYKMNEGEAEYLMSFKKEILGEQIGFERGNFEVITITPDLDENEVYLIIDSFNNNDSTYLDVVVVDAAGLYQDEQVMNQFNNENMPIESLLQTKYVYRYMGGENKDTIAEALNSAKTLLEN